MDENQIISEYVILFTDIGLYDSAVLAFCIVHTNKRYDILGLGQERP